MNGTKKFQLIFCILTSLCITGVALLLVVHYRATEKNRIVYKASTLLDILAAEATSHVPKGRWDELRGFCDELFKSQNIHHLNISGTGNVKIYSKFRGGNPASSNLRSFSKEVPFQNGKMGIVHVVLNSEASRQRVNAFHT